LALTITTTTLRTTTTIIIIIRTTTIRTTTTTPSSEFIDFATTWSNYKSKWIQKKNVVHKK